MAEVKPFRALRYSERAGSLADLVAPPYDVISPAERDHYLARSPYNVVHLTLPDSEDEAGRELARWQREGAVEADDVAGAWVLSQDYVGPDGVARRRNALVAAMRAEPYERRVVLPHERTHRGPRESRLRLLRAARVQLEPILLLHEGPPVDLPATDPDVEVEGAKLWRIDDGSLLDGFEEQQLLIADGHHRYETTLAFHAEDGSAASAYTLAALVSTQEQGLTIFPTHRIAQHFTHDLDYGDDDPRELLQDIERRSRDRAAVVVATPRGSATVEGGGLDTELVEQLGPEGVSYTPSLDDALAAVESGHADAAFLLRPPSLQQVWSVARAGRTLPQKTTYFYPKLLSGLLFLPL